MKQNLILLPKVHRLWAVALAPMVLCAVCLCSCVTTSEPHSVVGATQWPGDVAINKDAGRGNVLIVKIQLENGEELPFLVDTGSPCTFFDNAYASRLGERTGQVVFKNFANRLKAGVYKMPKLYLNDTPLMCGDYALTIAMSNTIPDHLAEGVLGMDCLQHYCIQVDFDAGRMHFLSPYNLDETGLGKAFPIILSSEDQGSDGMVRPYICAGSLVGGDGQHLMIDSGYRVDGGLASVTFKRALHDRQAVANDRVVRSQDKDRVWFPDCTWEGQNYTNLLLGGGGNIMGLMFLARHMVTLDFPEKMMYLKQTSVGPMVDERILAARKFLNDLLEKDLLPGWSKGDEGTIYCEPYPDSVTFDGRKRGDEMINHYILETPSNAVDWKLQRAWRTDQNNRKSEDLPHR